MDDRHAFDIGRIRTNRFRFYKQTGDDPPFSPRWSWRGGVRGSDEVDAAAQRSTCDGPVRLRRVG
jgi:hypothetical protein